MYNNAGVVVVNFEVVRLASGYVYVCKYWSTLTNHDFLIRIPQLNARIRVARRFLFKQKISQFG
jgi:hypothetical protein